MPDPGSHPVSGPLPGRVVAVHRSADHTFAKSVSDEISILPGLGVEGDAHCGPRVKHRSRVAANPDQPNLRQVHLMSSEIFDEVGEAGFTVQPGDLGENITTEGIDLIGLPTGTLLRIGERALVSLTGLRNPCGQINGHEDGLLKAMVGNDENGNTVRKAGVMSVVMLGGTIRPGDEIVIALPPEPHVPMERV